jgi:hypothetical protein
MGSHEPTFEDVSPMVESSNSTDGKTFEFTFKCPKTGFKATGLATVPELVPESRGTNAASEIGSSLGLTAARDRIEEKVPGGRILGDAIQGAIGWRRGKKAQDQAVSAGQERLQNQEQQLVLDAFAQVADKFSWDSKGKRWVKA